MPGPLGLTKLPKPTQSLDPPAFASWSTGAAADLCEEGQISSSLRLCHVWAPVAKDVALPWACWPLTGEDAALGGWASEAEAGIVQKSSGGLGEDSK